MARHYTRRRFLRDAGSATALIAVGMSCGGDEDEEAIPAGPNVVAITHREEIDAAVRRAVALGLGIASPLEAELRFDEVEDAESIEGIFTAPA